MGTQPYSPSDSEASAYRRMHYRRVGIATIVLLILSSLFIRAGFWQLDRAEQKNTLQATFDAGASAAPLQTLPDNTAATELRFRLFTLDGHYEPERQILLDNMVSGGQNGYQVLTPFRTGVTTVLINRGWLRSSADRSVLPAISVDDSPRTIVVRLNTLPAPGIRLDAPVDTSGSWPRRMLYPDQQELAAALGKDVPDYQLLLDANQPNGYQRDWQAVGTGSQIHYGYAFQWFAFALLSLILYIIGIRRWNRQRQNEQK